VGKGTENHMIWVDLTNKNIDGWTAAWVLEVAGIICNRQTIPFDPRSPYYPSGIRLGTPAVTTRGMKEKEMKQIAKWINEVIEYVRKMDLKNIGSADKEKDQTARKKFKEEIFKEKTLSLIKEAVKNFCQKFLIY
jgi:glycine hydroxymethyltransferase